MSCFSGMEESSHCSYYLTTALGWCSAGGYVFLGEKEKSWLRWLRHRAGLFTQGWESCAAAAATCQRPCHGAAPTATFSWSRGESPGTAGGGIAQDF